MNNTANHGINPVNTVYYRGLIRSCNYTCGYCPFSKTKKSDSQLTKDQLALTRFTEWIEKQKTVHTVVFIPYGEALIHPYYWQALARLSHFPHITKLAVQTNLSFDIDLILRQYPELNHTKLHLWCSYHPAQITSDRFLVQCHKLKCADIAFSVGMVGDTEQLENILLMRQQLDSDIYLWINAMDGASRPYTEQEIQDLLAIDPLFYLELRRKHCEPELCVAGKTSILVDGNGNIQPCVLNRKSLGNIYNPNAPEKNSAAGTPKYCDCYLTYHHRTDIGERYLFDENEAFRVPGRLSKTVFFDLDGTLTDSRGIIAPDTLSCLEYLHQKMPIYLCTQRPLENIRKEYPELLPHMDGGVFANGGFLYLFADFYQEVMGMNTTLVHRFLRNYRSYQQDGMTYKVVLKTSHIPPELAEHYHVVQEDGIVSITAKNATKLCGIQKLCQYLNLTKEDIIVVGNSENDLEVLCYYPKAVTVQAADSRIKEHAVAMTIKQLLMFL